MFQIQRSEDHFFISFFERLEKGIYKSFDREKSEPFAICVNTDITCKGLTTVDDYFDGITSEEIGQILGGN